MEGKPLGVAQASHCMVEVDRSFVASGGVVKVITHKKEMMMIGKA